MACPFTARALCIEIAAHCPCGCAKLGGADIWNGRWKLLIESMMEIIKKIIMPIKRQAKWGGRCFGLSCFFFWSSIRDFVPVNTDVYTYIDLNADAHMAASSFGFLTEDKVSLKCLELDRTSGLTLTLRLQATQVTGASDPADGTSTFLFNRWHWIHQHPLTHSQKSWQVCQIQLLGPP